MHADELRRAVNKVVEVLTKSDILSVIREYRTAKGDDRAVAAARLGHSGAVIMENMDKFSASERLVAKILYLDNLGTTQYWQTLLGSASDPSKNAAELVHLYSRVMFASNHLPNLSKLLAPVVNEVSAVPLNAGEANLTIRLTDAGEKAADPDRIARSIDGIDMLYSACASIARKPAMDLRLDNITGKEDRDISFTGEKDSVAALGAVIRSIPEALSQYGDDDDLDLETLVSSLPIFDDLTTLANLGKFTQDDLKDISETMHQGALLVLESGVVLVQKPAPKAPAAQVVVAPETIQESDPPTLTRRASVSPLPSANNEAAAAPAAPTSERDEHYERYLREREAMQQQGSGASQKSPQAIAKQDAVDEMLRNLGRSRDS